MATPRSTMGAGASAIHPALIKASLAANAAEAEVQQVAHYLAELLRDIHGGNWRVNINHSSLFVCIAYDFSDRPAEPKPEVA